MANTEPKLMTASEAKAAAAASIAYALLTPEAIETLVFELGCKVQILEDGESRADGARLCSVERITMT